MGHPVMVEFVMKEHDRAGAGDRLVVVGNIPQLGNWVPRSGLPMLWDSLTTSCTATVNLPSGLTFEYKIVRFNDDRKGITWMVGANRAILVPQFAAMLSIINMWDVIAGSTPVTITFGMIKQLERGQHLLLSGDSVELGHWKRQRAHTMIWHVGNRWKNVAAGSTINYKYIRASEHGEEIEWMPGSNRVLHVPKGPVALAVLNHWTTYPDTSVPTQLPSKVQNVAIYFVLEHQCTLGHLFKLVGNLNKLGNWDPHKAQRMIWHFNNIWIAVINLHAGTFLEYKIALVQEADDHVIQWQAGTNKRLLVPDTDHEVVIKELWQHWQQ